MEEKAFYFLKELIEAPSPSGFDQPAQRVLRQHLDGVVDFQSTDVMGNLISRINSDRKDAPRVMLAGHCDEIGFMVQYIDDQGFISFAPIGGVDAHLVPGQRVTIHSVAGPVRGVVGKKPIHLIEAKERETVVPFKDQYIDIGVENKEAAEKLIAIGDPMTFAVGIERLQGDIVVSRAFDDKMGAWIVARVLQEVRRAGVPPVELYGVSTVQEEVGLRGATTSTFGVDPDVGIAIDVGFATDCPGHDKRQHGDSKVGAGPILSRGANINPFLFELMVETAKEEKIPYQVQGAARATGTDANVMQLTRSGVATSLISVPLRYMHSPGEVLSLADLQSTVKLLTAVIYRITDRKMFIPS
jgi:endoglucanase